MWNCIQSDGGEIPSGGSQQSWCLDDVVQQVGLKEREADAIVTKRRLRIPSLGAQQQLNRNVPHRAKLTNLMTQVRVAFHDG